MNRIVQLMRNWVCSYLGWVTMLDNDGGSEQYDGTATPPLFIQDVSNRDNYRILPDYYLKQQFSKYIQLNAQRIYSDPGSEATVTNVAFLNPDGTVVMIVVNQNDRAQRLRVETESKQFIVEIPRKSVATYKWKSGTGTNSVFSANVNLALGKSVTASSNDGSMTGAMAVDGNTGTRWASGWTDNEWICVDLGSSMAINQVVLNWEAAYGRDYKIQVSNDASNWTTIYHETNGDGDINTLNVSGTGRYVRMLGIQRGSPWGYSLHEFEVYNNDGLVIPFESGVYYSLEAKCSTASFI